MKNSPLRVGLTGGIGTGKSTVGQIFKLLGVPVYDADSMAKRLMVEDENLITAIKDEFGSESYRSGSLNRQFLAEKVFKSEDLLDKLNSLVHPAVASDFDIWASKFKGKYILKEAALLFESGSYNELDDVILVLSPLETRIERIAKRDPQRSPEQILNIIERQMPVDQAKGMADFIIDNDESHMLIPQVYELHNLLNSY
ncbi:MAG: dephospho-CoA kinase [Bacteroidetes bacterium]|nr:MAG: dephospho-CoA kinase [Bacteroidota bacterium]